MGVSGRPLRPKGQQSIPPDDRLLLEMPGGGGFGDPLDRDPLRVAEDVVNGYVSVASAARDYGVVIDAEGRPDEAATAVLRARIRAG